MTSGRPSPDRRTDRRTGRRAGRHRGSRVVSSATAAFVLTATLAAALAAGCGGEAIATEPAGPPPGPPPPPSDARPAKVVDDLTPPDADTLRILRESPAGLPVIAIEVKGRRYEVELAATEASRSRGLGGRRALPAGTGMLFVHPDNYRRNYWMKDCLVAMDIAFLDRQGRIVALHRMPVEPPRAEGESPSAYAARLKRYSSRRPARYALEVPPGDLERLALRLGDTLPIPRKPLDELAARERLGRPR